jgi:hypothetical protein
VCTAGGASTLCDQCILGDPGSAGKWDGRSAGYPRDKLRYCSHTGQFCPVMRLSAEFLRRRPTGSWSGRRASKVRNQDHDHCFKSNALPDPAGNIFDVFAGPGQESSGNVAWGGRDVAGRINVPGTGDRPGAIRSTAGREPDDLRPALYRCVVSGPQQACDGDQITILFDVANCSEGTHDISVKVNRPAGLLETFDYPGVPPGASITQEVQVTQRCNGGGPTVYTIEAIATNECGDTVATGCSLIVECIKPPCMTVACDTPGQACPGEEIPITVFAENCSDRPADILVTISGPGGELGQQLFAGVPAFGNVAFEQFVIHECEPGAVAQYTVTAIATNECGEAIGVAECVVECGSPPCVEVACEGPPMALDGEAIEISAAAINCSAGAEDFIVRVYSPEGDQLCEYLFAGVAPGAAVQVVCPISSSAKSPRL